MRVGLQLLLLGKRFTCHKGQDYVYSSHVRNVMYSLDGLNKYSLKNDHCMFYCYFSLYNPDISPHICLNTLRHGQMAFTILHNFISLTLP